MEESLKREEYSKMLEELYNRIVDECRTVHFFVLSFSEKAYFSPTSPLFGQVVQAKFSSLLYDLEEAAKCLALNRPTASAFHSIRCLEAGIRALSRCLGIADPTRASQRNWGALLKTLKDAIDQRWPGSSTRLSGEGQFFDTAYAALAAMQNPWRNATMHLDRKYTEEEAGHIFEMVGGFMKTIAVRMDEDGLPLA
jgi:hypothetical protein